MDISAVMSLGKRVVTYGECSDPNRISEIIGNTKHSLDDIRPERFKSRGEGLRYGLDISSWPTGSSKIGMWALRFSDVAKDYESLRTACKDVESKYGALQCGNFPHLLSLSKIFYELHLRGILDLAVVDPASLWLGENYRLYSLYLRCTKEGAEIRKRWVAEMYANTTFFLFVERDAKR